MYDITIIGGGPAGATLARLLGDRFKILVVDRRNLNTEYNNEIYKKCCGGLLAPDAQKMLAKLGLGVPKEVLTSPQLFTVRNVDFDNNLERYYQRNYINVDREKFDRWLVSLISNNVDFEPRCLFLGSKSYENLIKVTLKRGDKIFNVHTKYLIGADGATSLVRKKVYKEQM